MNADFNLRHTPRGARVAIVGPTSSGKSTLANALFRRHVLPTNALPNTLLPVFISTGEAGGYVVTLEGDGLLQCTDLEPPGEARRYAT